MYYEVFSEQCLKEKKKIVSYWGGKVREELMYILYTTIFLHLILAQNKTGKKSS